MIQPFVGDSSEIAFLVVDDDVVRSLCEFLDCGSEEFCCEWACLEECRDVCGRPQRSGCGGFPVNDTCLRGRYRVSECQMRKIAEITYNLSNVIFVNEHVLETKIMAVQRELFSSTSTLPV